MNGLVFTTYIKMAEEDFGMNILDQAIENAKIESGGAYTSIDNYNYKEIIRLNKALSTATGVPGKQLMYAFGNHFFRQVTSINGTRKMHEAKPMLDKIIEVINSNEITQPSQGNNPKLETRQVDNTLEVLLDCEKEIIWFMEKIVAETCRFLNFNQNGYNRYLSSNGQEVVVKRV